MRREPGSGALPAGEAERIAVELGEIAAALPRHVEVREDDVDAGLGRLVLTVLELIRQILEHQAIRRMEGGGLTDEEVERLGLTLLRLNERLQEMKGVFGLADEDLNLDLGPLGRLL